MKPGTTLDEVLPRRVTCDTSTLYHGQRLGHHARVTRVGFKADAGPLPSSPRYPTLPFDWGCDCSGGIVLAHALLSDALGEDSAEWHHVRFYSQVVRLLARDEWELTATQIELWVIAREGGGR